MNSNTEYTWESQISKVVFAMQLATVSQHSWHRAGRADAGTQTVTFATPAPVAEYVAPGPAVFTASAPPPAATCAATPAPAPVIEYVAPASAVTDTLLSSVIEYGAPVWCHPRNTSSSDRICGTCTYCHLCNTSSSDRICGTCTCWRPCNTSSSDRKRGTCTCWRPCNTSSSDRICGTCTYCHLCNTSSSDRICDALACDWVHRTSTISDFCYAQLAVSFRPHHGSRHHWCQPWHHQFGEPAMLHDAPQPHRSLIHFLPWTSVPRLCTTKSVRNCSLPRRRPRTYHAARNLFERFRVFLELISRFEFEFCRRGNYIFWTIRIFGVFKVQPQAMWPYMCLCCGLFVTTQFQFECCGVLDDWW